jgi:hypothetical protein
LSPRVLLTPHRRALYRRAKGATAADEFESVLPAGKPADA